ncbi:MAG: hypothetical protein HQ521_07585 [Bacteroidetes bacterium]|nr:hypothetical protein [Bacteroidota bacterium]
MSGRLLEKILFPLFIINITVSANGWAIFGFGVGEAIYWLIIAIAFGIGFNSPYRNTVVILFTLTIIFKSFELVFSNDIVTFIGKMLLGVIFIISGAKIYGKNPGLLHKQLIIFMILSIPVMLLQITGVSYIFMGWNTEIAHDLSILSYEEIGSFKNFHLYPTLFVKSKELIYFIAQGRPSGLLYSNNVLSVFVTITIALNFILVKDIKIRYSNIIITIALVLTRSLLCIGTTLLIYLIFILLGSSWWRKRAGMFLRLLIFVSLGYWFIFPGLFDAFFSESKLYGSLLPRLIDIGNVLHLDFVDGLFKSQRAMLNLSHLNMEDSYSGISIILKSVAAIPISIGLVILTKMYISRLRTFIYYANYPIIVYMVFIITCIITQLGVPYLGAPSFQFILGFGLYPLFTKLWKNKPSLPTS